MSKSVKKPYGKKAALIHPARHLLVLGSLSVMAVVLMYRAADLQVMNNDFLQDQGDARSLRSVNIAAHRGMITDRYGEPLAISTPVDSVWANPRELLLARDQWPRLAKMLEMSVDELQNRLVPRATREFVYLKRHINPDLALQIKKLEIPGVSLQREYRRYYPAGEVTAHVVGFTNVDDEGQEGMELAYDEWLRGETGSKRVIKNRLGYVVENVDSIRAPSPGKDLRLSIDRNIQYLAYRELKTAINQHRATSGSVVVLDARSNEVLAMVNQPSYNPNNRSTLHSEFLRNRAVTDVFEPGSTIKPFTVAAALETGKYRPESMVDTSPGYFKVGSNTIRDSHNYGAIDLSTVIQKSSNVGVGKIALDLEAAQLWETFSRVGFGSMTGSSFPGEASGLLSEHWHWHDIDRATMAFGYGLSVTPLQLAQAYSVLADKGRFKPVSFLTVDKPAVVDTVLSEKTARQIVSMMEKVVGDKGTGSLARVLGYRVAGKTGTVQKSSKSGGYTEDSYLALFVGMAPASHPRLVIAVVINEPRNEDYYGGRVAAPVFSRVMAGALRQMGLAPDDVKSTYVQSDRPVHVAAGGM